MNTHLIGTRYKHSKSPMENFINLLQSNRASNLYRKLINTSLNNTNNTQSTYLENLLLEDYCKLHPLVTDTPFLELISRYLTKPSAVITPLELIQLTDLNSVWEIRLARSTLNPTLFKLSYKEYIYGN